MGALLARADLRTRVAAIDPGLLRLRLASVALASMLLAAGVTAALRATVAGGEPVTVVLFAGVLAMISNLAVNEPTLARLRTTTTLMALPALASTVVGTLLAARPVAAAVVFVAVMMTAVWVRRWGPRGFALGMAGFMPYFFTQFLGATPAQLPWLLVAVVTGLGATLALRGFLLAERPERTLRRLLVAFRARAWAGVRATDEVLASVDDRGSRARRVGGPEVALARLRRARRRLNETALSVEDQLEQTPAGRVWPGLDDDTLALRVFDAELSLERLAVAVRRLVHPPDGGPGPGPEHAREVTALRVGLARLRGALRRGAGHDDVLEATADARGAVAGLVADTSGGGAATDPTRSAVDGRLQRTAFAVHRVADALHHAQRDAPARAVTVDARRPTGRDRGEPGPDDARPDPAVEPSAPPPQAAPPGLALSTRQAVQVGVATSLAIVVGEMVAPSRWYWAVIAAFVVFAGTQSRGDLLGRGWGRVAGTALGVAAGMALAALVGGAPVPSLVLLFGCVFLGLYLVRISPGLLAFWITAVLALVYGLMGRFSVEVLVLRIEETVIGALASILAAFLVLPRGTRAAFGEAVDELVEVMDDVLDVAVDRLAGGRGPTAARARAREMDTALDAVRRRARPLVRPAALRRGRTDHRRAVRVLVVCDHYTRALARLSDTVSDPRWRPTLRPAGDRVRANLDALRRVLAAPSPGGDGDVVVGSAEELVDAAESYAASAGPGRHPGPAARRQEMLTAVRLLRRIDQAVVALALDLGAGRMDGDPGQSPRTAASSGLANTRSGS